MNKYIEQAEKFLRDTNTILSIEFLKYDFYFDGDKEKRDIYQFTLSRGRAKYTATFGNSIANSCIKVNLANRVRLISLDELRPNIQKMIRKGNVDTPEKKYAINSNVASSLGFYSLGKASITIPEKVSAYDILACLTKYNPGSFNNFCLDYGYDNDSIKAKKIYDNVVQEWLGISSLYNPDELEALSDIQ